MFNNPLGPSYTPKSSESLNPSHNDSLKTGDSLPKNLTPLSQKTAEKTSFFRNWVRTPLKFTGQILGNLRNIGQEINFRIRDGVDYVFNAGRAANARKLQAMKEPEEELLEADENEQMWKGRLEKKMDKQVLSIPENSHFADSDMILLSDDYKGKRPLNAIQQTELEWADKVFDEIQKEEIFKLEGTDEFNKKVLELIKILLTRPVGRAIFKNLKAELAKKEILNNKPELRIMSFFKNQICSNDINDSHTIDLCLDYTGVVDMTETPQGQRKLMRDHNLILTNAMSLGHELIHLIHDLHSKKIFSQDLATAPLMDKRFHNLEEQKTITGVGKDLFKPPPRATLETYNDIKDKTSQEQLNSSFEEELKSDYDYINENILRTEFSLGYRIDHMGLPIPSNLLLTAEKEVPPEIGGYVSYLITDGFVSDFISFISLNKEVDFNKIKIGTKNPETLTLFILKKIFRVEDIQMRTTLLESFLKNKEDLDLSKVGEVEINEGDSIWGDKWISKPLVFAALETTHHETIIPLLLKKNVDLNKQDENGWTALHLAIIYGRSQTKLIHSLLDTNKINFTLVTKEGKTAEDFLKNSTSFDKYEKKALLKKFHQGKSLSG